MLYNNEVSFGQRQKIECSIDNTTGVACSKSGARLGALQVTNTATPNHLMCYNQPSYDLRAFTT